MKTLYLLRHAKSSWGDRELPDHDRPLNARGRLAAAALGRHLRERAPPDVILASTARRVEETLTLLLPAAGWQTVPTTRAELYLADAETLLAALRHGADGAASAMLVGHNPGMQDFALRLVGEVADDAAHARRARLKRKYPTAGFAVIVFPAAATWRDLAWGMGRLDDFVAPRDLADG